MRQLEPIDRTFPRDADVSTLSDRELDIELTIAAVALVPRRLERYELLLAERDRRRSHVAALAGV
jgi:hypothetical protein